jgi:hypothetical protein
MEIGQALHPIRPERKADEDSRRLFFCDLHNGFAHVKSKDCGHEYQLAFPRKCRGFQRVMFNTFLAPIL